MRTTIANWMLVLGVTVGSLAAAGSKKAYRWLEIDLRVDQSGEVLYETVTHQRVPGEKPLEIAKGGDKLDASTITRLTNSGVDRVRVRHPAHDSEPVSSAEARGRVLHKFIEIEGQTQSFKDGRVLTAALVKRAREAGLETLSVRNSEEDGELLDFVLADPPEPARAGDPYDQAFWEPDEYEGWSKPVPLTGPKAKPIEKGWLELERTIELPRRIAAGTFVDDQLVELFREKQLDQIDVKITAPFSWAGWTQRWYFLGAVAMILAAIGLKRSSSTTIADVPGESTPADEVRQALQQLLNECEQLAQAAPHLAVDEIHRAIDPIHSGSLYRILDGRESIRKALGLAGYAHVFGPLASGERMLNRAWSAAVDGYVDEARDCAQKAAPHFAEALSAWPKA